MAVAKVLFRSGGPLANAIPEGAFSCRAVEAALMEGFKGEEEEDGG